MGERVGYQRVSSVYQNLDRQEETMATCDKVYSDKASGKDRNRPGLQQALDYVREGDTLVLHELSRFGRNLMDIETMILDLVGRGVAVEIVKENFRFTDDKDPMQELMMRMLGAVAQYHRDIIKELQMEGIRAAQKKGKVKFGRPAKITPEVLEQIKTRCIPGSNKAAIAKELGISRTALYRALQA